MGRMTWHQATPRRLEPGPGRDYGTGVPRPTRRAAPGRRNRNSTAVSCYDTCVGPDHPLSAGWADSDCDITCSGADPLFHGQIPPGRARPLSPYGIG